jgi:hypothetical protein
MYGDYTPYSLPTWALGLPRVLPHKPRKSERITMSKSFVKWRVRSGEGGGLEDLGAVAVSG